MPTTPYANLPTEKWLKKTEELLAAHPLKSAEIVDVVLKVWEDILTSAIGNKRFKIGSDLLPKPQIMAFFLHELIPLEFSARHPGVWRGDKTSKEKGLVCVPDDKFSVEIKASSHPSQIFGNRSYAQQPTATKKTKSGYYLAINFQKFLNAGKNPQVTRIRFGWLDHADWTGQKAQTGQQARLSPAVEKHKLLLLYPSK